MNTASPSYLNDDGYPEKRLHAVKTVSDAGLTKSLKVVKPVKSKLYGSHRLKSIVLLEKVNSFRRTKGDLPGAPAKLGL